MNLAQIEIEEFCEAALKFGFEIDPSDLERDIRDGCPVNANGTINLLEYTAWLHTEQALIFNR